MTNNLLGISIDRALVSEEPIENISFTDEILENKDTVNLSFHNVEFERCRFFGCIFEKSSFRKVLFRNCDFSNCDFSDSYIRDVTFKNSKGVGAKFVKSRLINIKAEDSNFSYANLGSTKIEK